MLSDAVRMMKTPENSQRGDGFLEAAHRSVSEAMRLWASPSPSQ